MTTPSPHAFVTPSPSGYPREGPPALPYRYAPHAQLSKSGYQYSCLTLLYLSGFAVHSYTSLVYYSMIYLAAYMFAEQLALSPMSHTLSSLACKLFQTQI